MKRGEKITIERTASGLYKITIPHKKQSTIGAAASTILALAHEVFIDEATEIPDANPR